MWGALLSNNRREITERVNIEDQCLGLVRSLGLAGSHSPRVPRDAVFNSRLKSRAMLDCVERKNAIPRVVAKVFPALCDQRQKCFQRCTRF